MSLCPSRQQVLRAAAVDLHEGTPCSTIRRARRHCRAKWSQLLIADAVRSLRLGGLLLDRERLRCGRLHPVRQLKALDPRREFGLRRIRLQAVAVERLQQVELIALRDVGQSVGPVQIVDRRTLGLQGRPLIDPRQEAAPPVLGVPLGQSAPFGVVHHHEPRQVLVLAAESVGDPRADGREAHPRHAGVDLEQRRRMVVGVGPARMDERHLVDVLRHPREDVRAPRSALAVLRETERRLHQPADGVLKETGCVVEVLQRQPVPFLQLGFVVPGIDVGRPAVHEQVDDRLRPSRKVPVPRSQRIRCRRRRRRAEESLRVQQIGQREHADSPAGALQQLAA